MTKVRERIIAWVGVGVAIMSVVALSSVVIIQQLISNHAAPANTTPTPTTSVSAAQAACQDKQTESTLPAPQVYIPSGTVSNLSTTDLTVGTGATAQHGDCLIVKYYGTLASNGTVFDEDFSNTQGLAFVVGTGQVIAGWDQGVLGMKVGGTRRLVIPASLAYGNNSPGAAVPADSALVFVVKLLRIQQN